MAALFWGADNVLHAAQVTERSKQKRAAETEREDLQQKLSALKRDIDATETARSHAADALAVSEAAISQANRSLHELTNERQQTEAKLAKLTKAQTDLVKAVNLQQAKLAKLVREQYIAGNEDRTKLLLSGDNPNRINRELRYLGYLSTAQAKMVETLRANLQAVELNKAAVQNATDELAEIGGEATQQKALLEKEKGRHAMLVAQLSTKLSAQRREAGTLERDEQRLAGLVDKLTVLMEDQQKADLAQQARRREDAARARAERERRAIQAKNAAKDGAGKSRIPASDNIDNDEPPSKFLARNELASTPVIQDDISGASFSSLRGSLRLPIQGELIARYGSKRGDGPNWKGLFIRASEGADVKAIAPGKVIFAEWLRGFGNLIIVDHGTQYMSIYGNNQAVLKRPGDTVKSGEVIASAGNSGGNEQSGLYFELRHQGRAFDPLAWMVADSAK